MYLILINRNFIMKNAKSEKTVKYVFKNARFLNFFDKEK